MVEDDDDRAIFLGDFNEPDEMPITVTPTGLDPIELPLAIFDERPQMDDPAYKNGAKISGNHPILRVRSSDFPMSYLGQATVQVRGKIYNVFDIKEDRTGMSMVEMKRAD